MPDATLISKYFNGECTAEEEKAVLEYFANGDNREFEALLQQSWNTVPASDIGDVVTRRMLGNIEKATYAKPTRWWQHWQRAAAAILILATVGGALWTNRRKSPPPALATTWKTISNSQHRLQLTILPDSTRVWLSPQSTLSYITREKERSIQLQGEAFFDVAKDEQHPFIIYTGHVATQVLGTSFNIEAYQRENAIRISLVRGAVAIANTDSTGRLSSTVATLSPGEMLQYDKQNHQYKTEKIRLTGADEWTNGSLVFNEVPLTDAVHRVAGRYGLKVRFAKGAAALLKNKRLTAVFREESSTDILNNMLFISNCQLRQRGNEFEIYAIQ